MDNWGTTEIRYKKDTNKFNLIENTFKGFFFAKMIIMIKNKKIEVLFNTFHGLIFILEYIFEDDTIQDLKNHLDFNVLKVEVYEKNMLLNNIIHLYIEILEKNKFICN